jgi:phenylacetate-CoA ligase
VYLKEDEEMVLAGSSYYDEIETMPYVEKQKYYDEKVRWIVEHAYKYAPAIKAKMDQAGVTPSDIKSLKDLEKIPITSKDDFVRMQKENPPFGGVLTVPLNQLKSICMSPGPIYNTPGNDNTYLRRVEKSYFGCGLRPGDILLNTFSYHVSAMGILLDTPLKRMGVTVIPMGGGNKQLQLQVMHDLKVTVFTGSAGFLLELLRTAGEAGYDAKKDFNLRLVISPFDHEAMKIIEKEYGIQAAEFYGTADVGIIAYNCEQKLGMHICEEMIVEIVDMNTGKQLGPQQVGKVVVTPLDETLPFIRYAPNDLSSWCDEPCPCGRTSFKLNPIAGWVGESVKVRGMFVHPSQLAIVVGKFPQIGRYQLVCHRVNEKDFLAFHFETKEDDINAREMEESFKSLFRDICRLNLDKMECVSKGSIPTDGKPIVDQRPPDSK